MVLVQRSWYLLLVGVSSRENCICLWVQTRSAQRCIVHRLSSADAGASSIPSSAAATEMDDSSAAGPLHFDRGVALSD